MKVEFEHKTYQIMKKIEFDSKMFRDPRIKWCKENLGPVAFLNEGEGRWDRDFEYVDNDQNIKETFSFREEKDLTLFLLRFS